MNVEAKYDLLLCGGTLADPLSGEIKPLDVAIAGGVVKAIDQGIPKSAAMRVADVGGAIVTPGLIDIHCHLYPKLPHDDPDRLHNVEADAHVLQNGVTTAVDAGTCGARDFISFREQVLTQSRVRLLAFVNISDGGMVNQSSEQDLRNYHPDAAAEIASAYPEAVGIKTAHYWVGKPFDREHPPWGAIDSALRAGERCGRPVMVDFQPTLPERSYPDLLNKLRPGDIHTHMYAQQFPVLDAFGKVNTFLTEARRRGIRFDLGHGACSFWFRNAVPSVRQGHVPDSLGTDLYFDNVTGPVIGMMNVMSKFLSMGMPFMEVLRRATTGPAQMLGLPELGVLKMGQPADIAVLALRKGDFGFADGGRARMIGDTRVECLMTLRDGVVVYDPDARSMPLWETAPEAYWTPPGILPFAGSKA